MPYVVLNFHTCSTLMWLVSFIQKSLSFLIEMRDACRTIAMHLWHSNFYALRLNLYLLFSSSVTIINTRSCGWRLLVPHIFILLLVWVHCKLRHRWWNNVHIYVGLYRYSLSAKLWDENNVQNVKARMNLYSQSRQQGLWEYFTRRIYMSYQP